MAKNKLYQMWSNMKARCYYKKYISFSYYGGRGIKVCDKWKESFDDFSEWALKNGWEDDLEIDRIDVNGDYCPDNCRFATKAQQSRNKRSNVWLEFNGKKMIKTDWANLIGVPPHSLNYRMNNNWPIEKILSPGKQSSNRFTMGKNYKK